jgi:hypothetical protein
MRIIARVAYPVGGLRHSGKQRKSRCTRMGRIHAYAAGRSDRKLKVNLLVEGDARNVMQLSAMPSPCG